MDYTLVADEVFSMRDVPSPLARSAALEWCSSHLDLLFRGFLKGRRSQLRGMVDYDVVLEQDFDVENPPQTDQQVG